MQIQALVENTSKIPDLSGEFGLSLLVQTNRHHVLFDFGASPLLLHNASTLGIDLATVDLAFLSHGHYDHGGGMAAFLKHNQTAPIYLQESAFDAHFSKRPPGITSIGLESELKSNPRMIFVPEQRKIDNELFLFSHVNGQAFLSECNRNLLTKEGETYLPDPFYHEQNLVITESSCHVLLAGCAHCGIVNILDTYERLMGGYPDLVVGGFHLMSPHAGKSANSLLLKALAHRLKQMPTIFYTCHCTGLGAYQRLKQEMGAQMHYLSTGMKVDWPQV